MKLKTNKQKTDHHQKRLRLLSFITNILALHRKGTILLFLGIQQLLVSSSGVHAAFLLEGTFGGRAGEGSQQRAMPKELHCFPRRLAVRHQIVLCGPES